MSEKQRRNVSDWMVARARTGFSMLRWGTSDMLPGVSWFLDGDRDKGFENERIVPSSQHAGEIDNWVRLPGREDTKVSRRPAKRPVVIVATNDKEWTRDYRTRDRAIAFKVRETALVIGRTASYKETEYPSLGGPFVAYPDDYCGFAGFGVRVGRGATEVSLGFCQKSGGIFIPAEGELKVTPVMDQAAFHEQYKGSAFF